MRNFEERRWAPCGSRPHVLVLPNDPVRRLLDAYAAQAAGWWAEQADQPAFHDVFEVLEHRAHLTLGWVDQLTADLPAGQWADLADALRTHLASLTPIDVPVGPAAAGLYAVEAYVPPDARLAGLAAAVRAAVRDVFGPDAAPEPATHPWRPHMTAMYCRADTAAVDSGSLTSRLNDTTLGTGELVSPAMLHVTQVALVSQDTWGGDGRLAWETDTVQMIPLAGAAPCSRPSWQDRADAYQTLLQAADAIQVRPAQNYPLATVQGPAVRARLLATHPTAAAIHALVDAATAAERAFDLPFDTSARDEGIAATGRQIRDAAAALESAMRGDLQVEAVAR